MASSGEREDWTEEEKLMRVKQGGEKRGEKQRRREGVKQRNKEK
jgi:hypothetical protein